MTQVSVEREIGGRMLRFETGKIARLATSSVVAYYGDSAVLAAVVRADPRPGLDFFPLQCDYRERMGAGGKFPGGFRKREGAPNEKETLTMRMMDRPIRPLFPDGFIDEIQIQAFPLSHDGQNDTDIWACTAASAALMLSDAPFEGPVATVRVGRIVTDDGEQFVLNPTFAQLEFSDLDMVISGHADGINMIEVGAAEVADSDVLAAIKFGYENGIKPILELQNELMQKVGRPARRFEPKGIPSEEIMNKVRSLVEERLTQLRQLKGKTERNTAIEVWRKQVIEANFPIPEGVSYTEHMKAVDRQSQAKEAFRRLEKKITHSLVSKQGIRADGRGLKDIRPIDIEVGIFPRTHGSSLFQRRRNAGDVHRHARHQLRRADGRRPDRRVQPEVHAALQLPQLQRRRSPADPRPRPARDRPRRARRAHRSSPSSPTSSSFPYTVRVISDILESNGSIVDGLGLRRMPGPDGRRRAHHQARSPASPSAWCRKATSTRCSPTSSARKITSATWTSRSAAPATASPPSSSTSRPKASPTRSSATRSNRPSEAAWTHPRKDGSDPARARARRSASGPRAC